MNRRKFVRNGIMSSVALASVNLSTSAKDGLSNSAETIASSVAPPAFELDELTVAELQSGMSSGKYSAHSLAKKYLDRIDDVDKHGPAINSVIELNPDALVAHNIGIDEVQRAVQQSNVNSPTGRLQGDKQAFTVQSSGQLTNAAAYRPLVVAYRRGSCV